MAPKLPLVFACAGCSPSGQLAYLLALELDRRGMAEMSCLAGVGAAKSYFLKKLQHREVWIIDGCAIECALGNFSNVGEGVNLHVRLHDLGIRKQDGLPTGDEFIAFFDEALKYINAKRAVVPPETTLCEAG